MLTVPSWICCEAGLARWRIKLHATFLFWRNVCSTLSHRVYLARHPSTPDRSARLTRNLKTGNVDKYYNQLHSRDPPGAEKNLYLCHNKRSSLDAFHASFFKHHRILSCRFNYCSGKPRVFCFPVRKLYLFFVFQGTQRNPRFSSSLMCKPYY